MGTIRELIAMGYMNLDTVFWSRLLQGNEQGFHPAGLPKAPGRDPKARGVGGNRASHLFEPLSTISIQSALPMPQSMSLFFS